MPARSPTIAVIDDDDEMRIALSRLLCARGFRPVSFPGGAAFLEASGFASYDCILLDLHMPEISGFDVLGRLAASQARPPIVVVTAHDEPGNRERALGLGAIEYLLKPVDQVILLAAIERAMQAGKSRPPLD